MVVIVVVVSSSLIYYKICNNSCTVIYSYRKHESRAENSKNKEKDSGLTLDLTKFWTANFEKQYLYYKLHYVCPKNAYFQRDITL
jgi:hypothetical protein